MQQQVTYAVMLDLAPPRSAPGRRATIGHRTAGQSLAAGTDPQPCRCSCCCDGGGCRCACEELSPPPQSSRCCCRCCCCQSRRRYCAAAAAAAAAVVILPNPCRGGRARPLVRLPRRKRSSPEPSTAAAASRDACTAPCNGPPAPAAATAPLPTATTTAATFSTAAWGTSQQRGCGGFRSPLTMLPHLRPPWHCRTGLYPAQAPRPEAHRSATHSNALGR